jgi:hypothetical protein
MAVQAVSFSLFPIVSILGFFSRFGAAIVIVLLIDDFALAFSRAMAMVAGIGLFFYALQVSVLSVFDAAPLNWLETRSVMGQVENARYFVVHSIVLNSDASLRRNAGCFWEPGAFAGYLVLAILCLWLARARYPKPIFFRAGALLILALLTTKSTTGYAVLLVIALLLLPFLSERFTPLVRITVMVVGLSVIVGGGYYAFTSLDFLGDKLDRVAAVAQIKKRGWQINRLGTVMHDWEYIKRRPLLGWGPSPEMRNALDWTPGLTTYAGNGFSNFTLMFGVVGIGAYLVAVYRSFSRLGASMWIAGGCVFVVALTLQGEAFLNFPLFLGLAALPFPVLRKARASNGRASLRAAGIAR